MGMTQKIYVQSLETVAITPSPTLREYKIDMFGTDGSSLSLSVDKVTFRLLAIRFKELIDILDIK